MKHRSPNTRQHPQLLSLAHQLTPMSIAAMTCQQREENHHKQPNNGRTVGILIPSKHRAAILFFMIITIQNDKDWTSRPSPSRNRLPQTMLISQTMLIRRRDVRWREMKIAPYKYPSRKEERKGAKIEQKSGRHKIKQNPALSFSPDSSRIGKPKRTRKQRRVGLKIKGRTRTFIGWS